MGIEITELLSGVGNAARHRERASEVGEGIGDEESRLVRCDVVGELAPQRAAGRQRSHARDGEHDSDAEQEQSRARIEDRVPVEDGQRDPEHREREQQRCDRQRREVITPASRRQNVAERIAEQVAPERYPGEKEIARERNGTYQHERAQAAVDPDIRVLSAEDHPARQEERQQEDEQLEEQHQVRPERRDDHHADIARNLGRHKDARQLQQPPRQQGEQQCQGQIAESGQALAEPDGPRRAGGLGGQLDHRGAVSNSPPE